MTKTTLLAAALAVGLITQAHAAGAVAPHAFTAQYQVLQGGSPLGEATVTLKPAGNGQFALSTTSKGTAGVAAMVAANTSEVSTFRWTGNAPEAVSYDYRLESSLKTKERHLKVDAASKQATVADGKKNYTFAAVPGMVERNLASLALGLALQAGKQDITLPVAVKSNVENQHYKVTGKEKVQVPAGSFDTMKMARTDADRGLTAWYAPSKYAVPVKMTQGDQDLTLLLVSYRAQ
jgi:opacity protein-like surface antigen